MPLFCPLIDKIKILYQYHKYILKEKEQILLFFF
nr:MAG TPA: hypothetical protein [Caudoviricetes sp.]